MIIIFKILLSCRFQSCKAIQFLMQYPEFQHHYSLYMQQQQQQQHHHHHYHANNHVMQHGTAASYADNYINDISPSSQSFIADQTAKPSYYYQQEHQHYHPYYYQPHHALQITPTAVSNNGPLQHWHGDGVSSTSTTTSAPPLPPTAQIMFHNSHGTNVFYSTLKPPQTPPFGHIAQIGGGGGVDDQQQQQQQSTQLLHHMQSGYRGKLN